MLGMDKYTMMEQERIDIIVRESARDIMKLYMGCMMIHDTNIDEEITGSIIRDINKVVGETHLALLLGLRDEYHEGHISKSDIVDYFIYIQNKTIEYVNMVDLKHEEIRSYVIESIMDYHKQVINDGIPLLDISEYDKTFG